MDHVAAYFAILAAIYAAALFLAGRWLARETSHRKD